MKGSKPKRSHGSKPIHAQCNSSMLSNGGSSPVCSVCMFHEWYKTKSHACGKPRLLQATLLQEPESHNMRHLPWYSSSSNDMELGILAKSHAVAAGTSGCLGALQRGAFFLALAFFGKGLKNFSTDALRCSCLQPSCCCLSFWRARRPR